MVQSGVTRLSREEFEVIIKNYEDAGRDATDLKKALANVYSHGNTKGVLTDAGIEQKVQELREQATISTGQCCICGQEGKLYSGTCEVCFQSWAHCIVKKE